MEKQAKTSFENNSAGIFRNIVAGFITEQFSLKNTMFKKKGSRKSPIKHRYEPHVEGGQVVERGILKGICYYLLKTKQDILSTLLLPFGGRGLKGRLDTRC